jgi:hypothetical protein
LDHSWGRNVSDYGLGSAGASLAARVLPGMTNIVTNGSDYGPAFYDVWAINPDTGLYTRSTWLKIPGAFGNFPYFWDVEPDVPV